VWVCLAERDAQRAPLTATPSEATDLKITPGPENGKRGGGSLEQKLDRNFVTENITAKQ